MPGFNNGVCFAENGFDFTGGAGNAPATNALGGSNPGITNTITVQNLSNTAGSAASFLASVAGISAGNCYTQYTIGNSFSWATGPDNTSGGKFKLTYSPSNSVTPSTGTTYFQLDQNVPNAKFFTQGLGSNFSKSGGAVETNATNTSNTANSSARLGANTGGTSAGDAYTFYSGMTTAWETGVKSSDSSYKILSGSDPANNVNLSGNATVSITSAGNVEFPLTSAFSAFATNQLNVTGDGTAYVVIFGTSSFDQNSNYNVSTGIFTAPVARRYHFSAGVTFSNIGAGHTTGTLQFVATGGIYSGFQGNPFAMSSSGALGMSISAYIDMAANDTVKVVLTISGSTKTINVNGSGPQTYFGGMLVA